MEKIDYEFLSRPDRNALKYLIEIIYRGVCMGAFSCKNKKRKYTFWLSMWMW